MDKYEELFTKFKNLCSQCEDKECRKFQSERLNRAYHQRYDKFIEKSKEV